MSLRRDSATARFPSGLRARGGGPMAATRKIGNISRSGETIARDDRAGRLSYRRQRDKPRGAPTCC
eukprot:8950909-Pyramimonas_sp.AAC.1